MHADLAGAKIWFEDSGGAGEPVVLLHAGTGSTRMWAQQMSAFSAAGYRVVAYDRRGYGRTLVEMPSDTTAAEDLRRLADALGMTRFHLLGTAAGGIVALDFALSFPERLRSLVLANTIGGVQDEGYLDLQSRLRPKPQFDALPAEIRELGPSYRATSPEGVRKWVELEHANRAEGTPTLPKTLNRITFSRLENIELPTLLLTGDADLYAPPAVLRMFEQRLRGSRSVVIPECGHSASWEQPELFNRTVLDFLKNH
jgi:pimeloyl-ACP methyl ester carboxylesterase